MTNSEDRVYYKDGVKFINLDEDEVIFREGSRGSDMYVITGGSIKIYLDRDGDEFELVTLNPGQFFGEMSLLEYEPRSANAKALEPTNLMVIEQDSFEKVMQKNPALVLKIMKALSSRLRESNKKLMRYKKDFEEQISDAINKGREETD